MHDDTLEEIPTRSMTTTSTVRFFTPLSSSSSSNTTTASISSSIRENQVTNLPMPLSQSQRILEQYQQTSELEISNDSSDLNSTMNTMNDTTTDNHSSSSSSPTIILRNSWYTHVTRRTCIVVSWISLFLWMLFFWYLYAPILVVIGLFWITWKWYRLYRHEQQSMSAPSSSSYRGIHNNNNNNNTSDIPLNHENDIEQVDIEQNYHVSSSISTTNTTSSPSNNTSSTVATRSIHQPIHRATQNRSRRRRFEQPSTTRNHSSSDNNNIHPLIRLRYGNEFTILDVEEFSFQAQLALAILESQRHILETGGYGHPDSLYEEGNGVSSQIQKQWKHFMYPTTATQEEEDKMKHHPSHDLKSSSTSLNDIASTKSFHTSSSTNGGLLFKGGIEEKTCSICLDEYQGGDSMIELPCCHTFHSDCITTWVKGHVRCPLCNCTLDME